MEISELTVTPQLAEVFLSKNAGNRPISIADVKKYARDMQSGNWKLTHQGLLFDANDNLVDGQHRLLACVKAGVSFQTLIVYHHEALVAKDLPIDDGRKRDRAFIHSVSKRLSSLASFALYLTQGEPSATISERRVAIDKLCPQFDLLSTSTLRGLSQTSVRLAVITHMRQHPQNQGYYTAQYEAAVKSHLEAMSPRVGSFYKQVVAERRHFDKNELFSRAYKAFDYDLRSTPKLTIKNEELAYEEAKAALISVWKREAR